MLLGPHPGAHTDDPSSAAGEDLSAVHIFTAVLTCMASCSSMWEGHLSLMNIKVQHEQGSYLGLSTFPRAVPTPQESLRLSMGSAL